MMFMRVFCLAVALAAFGPLSAFAAPPSSGGGEQTDARRRSLTQSENYMPLPPLTASVQADYRLRGVIQIEAGLELDSARDRRRVQMLMPRLRDGYVSALSLYTGVNYRFGDVPDVDRITELLQEATDRALGEDKARVLLGMVIIHAD